MATAQDVARLIDMTEAGDYDSYHEWSPSFDLKAKADVLAGMMLNWETTEPEGRKLILEFLRKLNKSWMDSAKPVTDIVARYAGLPEIVRIVHDEFLTSGRFCHYLLISMIELHVTQENWLSKIGALAAGKRFTESKKLLRACKVYEGIENLLADGRLT